MGIIEWFKHIFRKEEQSDIMSLRIKTLYEDLRYYYLNHKYNDPDFIVTWGIKLQDQNGQIEKIELNFNSLLSPITLEITSEQYLMSGLKESKSSYILKYIDKDNKGFTIYTQPIIINSDFDQDEIDLALFEIEDYLRSNLYE